MKLTVVTNLIQHGTRVQETRQTAGRMQMIRLMEAIDQFIAQETPALLEANAKRIKQLEEELATVRREVQELEASILAQVRAVNETNSQLVTKVAQLEAASASHGRAINQLMTLMNSHVHYYNIGKGQWSTTNRSGIG